MLTRQGKRTNAGNFVAQTLDVHRDVTNIIVNHTDDANLAYVNSALYANRWSNMKYIGNRIHQWLAYFQQSDDDRATLLAKLNERVLQPAVLANRGLSRRTNIEHTLVYVLKAAMQARDVHVMRSLSEAPFLAPMRPRLYTVLAIEDALKMSVDVFKNVVTLFNVNLREFDDFRRINTRQQPFIAAAASQGVSMLNAFQEMYGGFTRNDIQDNEWKHVIGHISDANTARWLRDTLHVTMADCKAHLPFPMDADPYDDDTFAKQLQSLHDVFAFEQVDVFEMWPLHQHHLISELCAAGGAGALLKLHTLFGYNRETAFVALDEADESVSCLVRAIRGGHANVMAVLHENYGFTVADLDSDYIGNTRGRRDVFDMLKVMYGFEGPMPIFTVYADISKNHVESLKAYVEYGWCSKEHLLADDQRFAASLHTWKADFFDDIMAIFDISIVDMLELEGFVGSLGQMQSATLNHILETHMTRQLVRTYFPKTFVSDILSMQATSVLHAMYSYRLLRLDDVRHDDDAAVLYAIEDGNMHALNLFVYVMNMPLRELKVVAQRAKNLHMKQAIASQFRIAI